MFQVFKICDGLIPIGELFNLTFMLDFKVRGLCLVLVFVKHYLENSFWKLREHHISVLKNRFCYLNLVFSLFFVFEQKKRGRN